MQSNKIFKCLLKKGVFKIDSVWAAWRFISDAHAPLELPFPSISSLFSTPTIAYFPLFSYKRHCVAHCLRFAYKAFWVLYSVDKDECSLFEKREKEIGIYIDRGKASFPRQNLKMEFDCASQHVYFCRELFRYSPVTQCGRVENYLKIDFLIAKQLPLCTEHAGRPHSLTCTGTRTFLFHFQFIKNSLPKCDVRFLKCSGLIAWPVCCRCDCGVFVGCEK